MLEATLMLVDPVASGLGVPRGDGRAVIAVPGFLAPDDSLVLLRRWLRLVGNRPHTAGFVFSVDCADRAVERVERLAEALHHDRAARRDRRPQPRRAPRAGDGRAPSRPRLARELDGRRPAGPARDQLADAGGRRTRAARGAPHALQPQSGMLPRATAAAPSPATTRRIPGGLRVKVVSGWVTLEGRVKHQRESDAAFAAASGVPGVGGITNEITVVSPGADG
jgi:hypothetical protein